MCHIACVMCHMSCITYHVSHVMSHMSKKEEEEEKGYIGGASWWRVCYQRGLPCLVFFLLGPYPLDWRIMID